MILLVALALLVRLPNLNQSLWYDEVSYTGVGLAGESLHWLMTEDVHPPLYASLLWAWIRVAGDSEVAVRLPSLLCGLASLGVLFSLAKRWFGVRVAFLATALMALSPAHVWYSQENKTNMLMLVLSTCLVWTAERAWRCDRKRDWALFAGCAVLAPWTNVFAVWVLAAVFLWLWGGVVQRPGRGRWRAVLAVSVVAALPFAPLFLKSLQHLESVRPTYLRAFTPVDVYKLLLVYLSHGNTLRTISPYAPFSAFLLQPWPYFLIDAFFAALLLAGVWHVARDRRQTSRGTALLVLYFTVPLACTFVASQINPQIYIERSMLILLPPFLLLIAVGALCALRGWLRHAAVVLLLVLGGVALFNLRVAKADRWTVYKPKNDWRAVAQYFRHARQEASEPVTIIAGVPVSVLVYYDHQTVEIAGPEMPLPAHAGIVVFYVFHGDKTALVEALERAKTNSFYVVEDIYWEGGIKQLLAQLEIDPSFRKLGEHAFRGVHVSQFAWTRMERPPGA